MNEPKRYKHKPIEVDAIRVTEGNQDALRAFCPCALPRQKGETLIPTLEGPVMAAPGDVLVRLNDGRFGVFSGDDFDTSFEACA